MDELFFSSQIIEAFICNGMFDGFPPSVIYKESVLSDL